MKQLIQRAARVATAIAILPASSLMAAPMAGFTLKAQSQHFSFYSRNQKTTDVNRSERQLERVSKLLGQTLRERSDVYQYDTPGDLAAVTGVYAGGVTYVSERQIHTTEAERDHEIVHLVAYQLGDPGRFFHEGLAVALGDGGRYFGQPVDRLAKRLMQGQTLASWMARFNAADPRDGYVVAGSFVKWLIDRFGVDKVSQFFRASTKGEPRPAFLATFGLPLDQAGATWAAQL